MNSPSTLKTLSTAVKIELFIAKLQDSQRRFKHARAAYLWMKICLEEINDQYISSMSVNMPEYEFFSCSTTYSLFYYVTPRHVIFINYAGSYGIYRKEDDANDKVNVDYYRTGTTCLVSIPSADDLDLWAV